MGSASSDGFGWRRLPVFLVTAHFMHRGSHTNQMPGTTHDLVDRRAVYRPSLER